MTHLLCWQAELQLEGNSLLFSRLELDPLQALDQRCCACRVFQLQVRRVAPVVALARLPR